MLAAKAKVLARDSQSVFQGGVYSTCFARGMGLVVPLLLIPFHDAGPVWVLPESIRRLILLWSHFVNYQALTHRYTRIGGLKPVTL
jgi:hypothetical protein